ncbi:MAG: CvpA family protein [Rhodovulum sp.]|uniref:CvpA family protein n=2 Tax=Rhodoplanes serenus TaxID=200615 RepID=UPI001478FCD7|nr:CvpA family protein [Rhodovulum sp.]
MNTIDVNSFDAVIGALMLLAALMGFVSGLLRSLATVLGYVAAVPLAVAAAPSINAMLAGPAATPPVPPAALVAGLVVVGGLVLGRVLRLLVAAFAGPLVSLPDRLLGALLGAGRIGLVAVVLVLVFERLIPPHLQPAFLADSRLRPVLASAGAAGLKTLPPEVEAVIDRLKRDLRL